MPFFIIIKTYPFTFPETAKQLSGIYSKASLSQSTSALPLCASCKVCSDFPPQEMDTCKASKSFHGLHGKIFHWSISVPPADLYGTPDKQKTAAREE